MLYKDIIFLLAKQCSLKSRKNYYITQGEWKKPKNFLLDNQDARIGMSRRLRKYKDNKNEQF